MLYRTSTTKEYFCRSSGVLLSWARDGIDADGRPSLDDARELPLGNWWSARPSQIPGIKPTPRIWLRLVPSKLIRASSSLPAAQRWPSERVVWEKGKREDVEEGKEKDDKRLGEEAVCIDWLLTRSFLLFCSLPSPRACTFRLDCGAFSGELMHGWLLLPTVRSSSNRQTTSWC